MEPHPRDDRDRPLVIGVIGGSSASAEASEAAREVGRRIARAGAVLVCGGLTGVMEAACRGCAEEGGVSLGVLPFDGKERANPYVTYVIATGMGYARNHIIVHTADALIAVDGSWGTLSELAIAAGVGKHVVALGSWRLVPSPGRTLDEGPGQVHEAGTPEEAVAKAIHLARRARGWPD